MRTSQHEDVTLHVAACVWPGGKACFRTAETDDTLLAAGAPGERTRSGRK